MKEFLNARRAVAKVLKLLTMQFGDRSLVAIKAHMVDPGSASALVDAIKYGGGCLPCPVS